MIAASSVNCGLMRRILVGMILLGVSMLAALVLSEYGVRLLSPQVTLFPRYVPSTEYPIELPPLSRIVESQGRRWDFTYTTNLIGRRGPYVAVDTVDSRCSVVLLGDSFTFGVGVGDQEVFSEVLRSDLGENYVVINGGVSGWGLDSEIKWHYRVGNSYRPRIVVLQFTANDPTDDVGVTTLENGDFVFHPYQDTKPAWQWSVSRSSLLQQSHLYALARSAYDAWRARRATEHRTSPSRKVANLDFQQAKYTALLTRFAQGLKADGVRLLFLSVTHRDGETGQYSYDLQSFPLVEQAVHRLAASGKLRFIDLPLAEMAQSPGSPQGHQWGSVHHRIVAARLAKAVTEQACP